YRPAIYNLVLVDRRGYSPTANELQKVCDVMLDYVWPPQTGQHAEIAHAIDREVLADSDAALPELGPRKYLRTNRYAVSAVRQVKVDRFIAGLRQRINDIEEEDRDQPLTHPLQHFGWSQDSSVRIQHHLNHEQSNYIMGLTEAVCRYLYRKRELQRKYVLDAYPIVFLAEPEHAIAAEVLLTCLGDGYTNRGGEFAHQSAGESNYSAETIPSRTWENQARFVLESSPYVENMRSETRRVK
ncbi:hypothetical protein B0J12DRAFT_544525, partial [Macrophomina phaseolina]